jgi:N utilization substance protein B
MASTPTPNAPGTPPETRPKSDARRRAARLGAVQALYQIAIGGATPEVVRGEFLEQWLDEEIEGLSLRAADRDFFDRLVMGVSGETENLDNMLTAVLAEDWPVERLETLLKMILRAGTYELGHWQDVPAQVVISQYVDLAHAFYDGKQPNMANGVLDRLARLLRPEEFDGEGSGETVIPEAG